MTHVYTTSCLEIWKINIRGKGREERGREKERFSLRLEQDISWCLSERDLDFENRIVWFVDSLVVALQKILPLSLTSSSIFSKINLNIAKLYVREWERKREREREVYPIMDVCINGILIPTSPWQQRLLILSQNSLIPLHPITFSHKIPASNESHATLGRQWHACMYTGRAVA